MQELPRRRLLKLPELPDYKITPSASVLSSRWQSARRDRARVAPRRAAGSRNRTSSLEPAPGGGTRAAPQPSSPARRACASRERQPRPTWFEWVLERGENSQCPWVGLSPRSGGGKPHRPRQRCAARVPRYYALRAGVWLRPWRHPDLAITQAEQDRARHRLRMRGEAGQRGGRVRSLGWS